MRYEAPQQGSTSSGVRALLSLLVPGLGQLLSRRLTHGTTILVAGLLILLVGQGVGQVAGLSAEVFYFLLLALPWWILQAYDAALDHPDVGLALHATGRRVFEQAHDIRYLGLLFLITAVMDLYIILINPAYALTLFCTKPEGALGLLAKIQSPVMHLVIGGGFLMVRRWALLAYLAYAAFGMLNVTANFACLGYGRVRTVSSPPSYYSPRMCGAGADDLFDRSVVSRSRFWTRNFDSVSGGVISLLSRTRTELRPEAQPHG